MRLRAPRHARPRHRPVVEGLETRALLSTPTALSSQAPSRSFPNPQVIQQSINLLYGPTSPTPMTPTPREIHRETFTARWIGGYTVGPPRYSDRASTIHVWSKTGGSSQFRKGIFDMVLFPPADPNATPTPGNPYANQVTGEASLFPKSLLQTAGLLIFDLNGTPNSGSDPLALPTHLNWVYDFNQSGGQYAAPVGFTQGAGTLDLQWMPNAHPRAGTMGSGRVVVTFQGLLNYNQINNDIAKVIS
jgi:hypothetical protein